MAGLREEIDAVERRTVRQVELGGRAVVIACCVLALLVGLVLPWLPGTSGWEVLLGHGSATGKPGMVPRLFAATSTGFGVFGSALTLALRRWGLAWICALGGWFASVDGLLAIWSRQSSTGQGASGPGIGLIIAEIATIVLAVNWFRTAWSRPGAQ